MTHPEGAPDACYLTKTFSHPFRVPAKINYVSGGLRLRSDHRLLSRSPAGCTLVNQIHYYHREGGLLRFKPSLTVGLLRRIQTETFSRP